MTNKKVPDELFKKIESKLNEGYNFVDYFLTIGSNPSVFKNDWLYESDISILNSKYKQSLKPIIINKFPSKDKTIASFDEAIIQHCFPNGFEVCEFNRQPDYKIFSIVLDNNNFCINFPHKYVVCLRFYESINNYKKLYDKYNEYQELNYPRDSNINNNDNENFDEDNIKATKSVDVYLYNLKKNKFFKQNIYYPEPLDEGFFDDDESISDTNLKFNKNKNQRKKAEINKFECYSKNSYLNKYKRYYIPKCICLISLYPFINELSKIIKIIYQYSLGEKQNHPLEKIINNLLIEVPTPPKGIYFIEYFLINEKILLKATPRNDFHVLNIEFHKLFMLLDVNKILEIFRYLMLNIKIIFFSQEISNLTPVIMTFASLLFPFQYPFNIVSVYPKEIFKFLEHPVAYIVGINEKYNKNFFSENDLDIDEYVLIVNIDKQELIKLEPYTKKRKRDLPELPSKYKTILENKINNCISEIEMNQKMFGKTDYFQKNIRKSFLEFQIDLMKDYPSYLNNDVYKHQDDRKSSVEKAFKLKEFLNKVPSEYYSFYEYFFGTQMFCDFLYKRMMPKDKIEYMDILFFEELLIQNKNDRIFLNSKKYLHKKKFSVQKPIPLTQQQIYHFNNLDTRNKLLANGIEITNLKDLSESQRSYSFNLDTNLNKESNIKNNPLKTNNEKNRKISKEEIISKKNNNKYIKNQPLFTYIIFPKLDNEYFYISDIKNYHIDFSMFQEVKNIDNQILSKSHLKRVEIKTNETTNYLYLLWLKLWTASFHYQDKIEQKYRFFQMLKIIKQINQHEIGLINNLFSALIKNGIDDDFILILYQKILNYQIIPSNFIFKKIGNIIDKMKSKLKIKVFNISKYLQSINEKIYKDSCESLYYKKNFRKRTLRSIYDGQILEQKVSFLMNENCDTCGKNIDMEQFLLRINDINDDLLWVNCPYCKGKYLPKLKIIFGSENNKNNKLALSTSIVDNVLLYSPKTLNYDMICNVINNDEINIEEFKSKYHPFFWNIIWYFKMNNLPYDFILPYEQNIIYRLIYNKPKENNINNNGMILSKHLKVTTCDYIKKAREQMEYRRNKWNNNDELIISSNEISIFIRPKSFYNKLNILKDSIDKYSNITNYA